MCTSYLIVNIYMHSVYEAFQTYSHVRIDIITPPHPYILNPEVWRTGKHYIIKLSKDKNNSTRFPICLCVRKFLKRSETKKNFGIYHTSKMMKGVWVFTCVKRNCKVNIGRDQAGIYFFRNLKLSDFIAIYCVCLTVFAIHAKCNPSVSKSGGYVIVMWLNNHNNPVWRREEKRKRWTL